MVFGINNFLKYLSFQKDVFEITKNENRHEFNFLRAYLPANRFKRIFTILKYVFAGSYKKMEEGKWWRPILGDLLK